MKIDAWHSKLDELRALSAETEWVEFKTAAQSFDIDELGRYVSSLANEANLHEQACGWLIFGVKDHRDPATGLRPVVGSAFKNSASTLNELKRHIAQGTSPAIAFQAVIEFPHPDCAAGSRVLMFQIPPAPRGMPVSWKGHWYGRVGEAQGGLGAKYETIRLQAAAMDWTAVVVTRDEAVLDTAGVARGRELYANKHPKRALELASWSTARFLSELGLARDGGFTRAGLLLFGSTESASLLGTGSPRLTWKLLNAAHAELDYAHFKLPLIQAIDALTTKVRMHTVRILPPGQLAPLEVSNYDPWVIREALLNCVAHQDYTQGGRTVVTELPDCLWFENEGAFIPGDLAAVLNTQDSIRRYRNPCLADAMVELGLIDTIGSGIKRMFRTQKDRLFPLPDFEFRQQPPSVKVCLYGQEIDPAFSRLLLTVTDLSLQDVVALDQIQKKRTIDQTAVAGLRRRKLIEGPKGGPYLAAAVANAANQRAQYARNSGLQKPTLKQLVLSLINQFGSATREDISQRLIDALPTMLTPQQKADKIRNLLAEMSNKDKTISANHPGRGAIWQRNSE
jgi:ATP-dependent DNA helicase RecG